MPISIAKILPPLPSSSGAKSLLQALQPGQILQGTALSENINGAMRLQIGVTQLTAQTTLSVSPGQPLTLQVEKTGQLPELRVMTKPSQKELTAWALKSSLPRQQPLPQLFKALSQYLSSPTSQSLPEPVKQVVEQILTRILSVESPNFKAEMSKALQLSGTQTESRLMRQTVFNSDLKLNLLRLIGLVKPYLTHSDTDIANRLPHSAQTAPNSPVRASAHHPIQSQSPPPSQSSVAPQSVETDATVKLLLDLFKHLDGAIARIQTNQLSSLPAEDTVRQVWQFDLPLRHENGFDLFHIRIVGDDRRHGTDSQTEWQLTLHMNLQALGPMKVRLHLIGETLSTIIWSERPETSKLVKQHLQQLRSGFESAGLAINKLEAFQGSALNEHEVPSDLMLLNEQV
jgi:hypothetical protein